MSDNMPYVAKYFRIFKQALKIDTIQLKIEPLDLLSCFADCLFRNNSVIYTYVWSSASEIKSVLL